MRPLDPGRTKSTRGRSESMIRGAIVGVADKGVASILGGVARQRRDHGLMSRSHANQGRSDAPGALRHAAPRREVRVGGILISDERPDLARRHPWASSRRASEI